MSKLHVRLLAAVLTAVGLALCYYKVEILGLPLLPTEQAEVWTVEARIEFKARRDTAVKVQFAIPRAPRGYTVLDENFVASDYGLTTDDNGLRRQARWAIRETHGWQVLYYRIHLAKDPAAEASPPPTGVVMPVEPQSLPEPLQAAARGLLNEVRSKSADNVTFAQALLQRLNAADADSNVSLLRQDITGPDDWARRIVAILREADVSARPVYLAILKDNASRGSLTPWVEVFDGDSWVDLNPSSGETGLPGDAIVWTVGSEPLLEITGGKNGRVEYSVRRHSQEMTQIAEQRARKMGSRIMEFSLFSLPVKTQNVYRVLLLVPIGAFLIVFLRNVVGLQTFGTFMPILIAAAFRETQLLWGVAMFCLLVALGLLLRFYLESLKLLLVPRLAAVLIIVILLMAMVSVMTYKLGLDRGVSVALFPMVIMAMTIERMSMVWEEFGPVEALKQGFGSLAVAVLGYLSMSSDYLGHLVFVFPELLLVVLALTLLLGRYTGYRLLELWRFRGALKG
ncbi:inactive transglutaminase family protein [Methylococcus capsulatus]|jgi:hypothetical protein|uniref:inactive transglutaminase family protein n=1 Tax=Methylococcus capsulatus TaxID=414 RepID=UPI0002DAB0CE|nr:inactive transglutaminase family protein [Methylococcus capsulatus]QXP88193.1 inactive transglutaminase family protein [Methylococcus capsulatus]QXP90449.1 inactive transglutaminase family protein [Methylococcus capsulatus]QXP94798.1 inactive transglutaminase family protein [Methylococcus capsulatus]UQN13228.1 inactive transglutaminase family protein [Methylococcus capsulatus]